jgi:hypothetical protein
MSLPIRIRQSAADLVSNALVELDALIAMTEQMHDHASLMRSNLNVLLELRRRLEIASQSKSH